MREAEHVLLVPLAVLLQGQIKVQEITLDNDGLKD